MNNSNDNTVCQFSYGGFNGAVHLLIEFVVVVLFKYKGKKSASQIRCRSIARGGKMQLGGHQQFLMNNSSEYILYQFSRGGFNGAVHVLIEFVVMELFKCKGKMSVPQIRCRSLAAGGKMQLGGHQQFLMNNSSDNIVWQFRYGGFNGAVHLLIKFVVEKLFKFKGKMSALLGGNHCRSPAGGGNIHPWWTPPITYE